RRKSNISRICCLNVNRLCRGLMTSISGIWKGAMFDVAGGQPVAVAIVTFEQFGELLAGEMAWTTLDGSSFRAVISGELVRKHFKAELGGSTGYSESRQIEGGTLEGTFEDEELTATLDATERDCSLALQRRINHAAI